MRLINGTPIPRFDLEAGKVYPILRRSVFVWPFVRLELAATHCSVQNVNASQLWKNLPKGIFLSFQKQSLASCRATGATRQNAVPEVRVRHGKV